MPRRKKCAVVGQSEAKRTWRVFQQRRSGTGAPRLWSTRCQAGWKSTRRAPSRPWRSRSYDVKLSWTVSAGPRRRCANVEGMTWPT